MNKQASDYYFFWGHTDQSFWIVEKEYWHNTKSINDTSFDGKLNAFLPPGFEEVSESQFYYYAEPHVGGLGSWEDGRQKLIEAGFTEMDDPNPEAGR